MNSIRNQGTRVTSVVSLLQGICCAVLLLLMSSHAVFAASPDAWKEFQQDVREKCLDKVRSVSDVKQVFVDSIGSQSAGLALLVYATDGQSTAKQVVICIYDKRTQIAELGSSFDISDLMFVQRMQTEIKALEDSNLQLTDNAITLENALNKWKWLSGILFILFVISAVYGLLNLKKIQHGLRQ